MTEVPGVLQSIDMPTLVKISKLQTSNDDDKIPLGETATTSDFTWMRQNFGGDDNTTNIARSESCLSRSLSENLMEGIELTAAKQSDGRSIEFNYIPEDIITKSIGANPKNENDSVCNEMSLSSVPLSSASVLFSSMNRQCRNFHKCDAFLKEKSFSVKDPNEENLRCGSEPQACDENGEIAPFESNMPNDNSNTLSEEQLLSQLMHSYASEKLNAQSHADVNETKKTGIIFTADDDRMEANRLSSWKPVFPIAESDSSRLELKVRKIGPKEAEYTGNYKELVETRICQYRSKYPGKLPDYLLMSCEQKQTEHQRVMDLMQRLGISGNKENLDLSAVTRSSTLDDFQIAQSQNNIDVYQVDNRNSCNDTSHDKSLEFCCDSTPTAKVDESTILLSQCKYSTKQVSKSVHEQICNNVPVQVRKSVENENEMFGLNPSNDSIEMALLDTQCDSPDLRPSIKRYASNSGMRGSDVARSRLKIGPFDSIDSNTPESQRSSPSRILEQSIGRLSLDDESIFYASQSPIPRYSLSSSNFHDSVCRAVVGIPELCLRDNAKDGSEGSLHDYSIDETMMLQNKRVRWDFEGRRTKEAPTTVQLKNGVAFHLGPLQTHGPNASRCPRFPDPLSLYPGTIQVQLGRLYSWLLGRDQIDRKSDISGKAIILSLTTQQIIDIVLKMLLEVTVATKSHPQNLSTDSSDVITGNTLIVVRSKDDIDTWARSIREGSEFSVVDHSSLPLKQRKSQSGAGNCSKFQVVLTTFDALKAPDVTVTLDSAGYVISHQVGVENGWYSTKTSTEQDVIADYKQFSVLHRITWRRVVFCDIVGRKCFLAKASTSRASAATALNAQSRFAFFVRCSESEKGKESLLQSDRQTIQSLASILRIRYEENRIDRVTIDFLEKITPNNSRQN